MTTLQQHLLYIIFLLTPFIASSATYTTINSGDWTNTTNVWSLDGVTPCGCSPSIPTNGDDIVINHNVNSNIAITINGGSTLTVSAGTTLEGPFVLSIENGTALMNGNITVTKLEIDASSVVDFNASVLTVSSQMEVFGTVNVDGSYLLMTGGNLIINQGAVFNTTNSGKVDIENGNITNSGQLNLCATCCFTTTGNWRNRPTGQVSGSGAATSTSGNMTNQGIWSLAVAWCSNGTDTGMPGIENCAGANAICSIVILPVEMGEITTSLNVANQPVIDWFTVSENNNSHFNILRLNSSEEWEVIGTVKGAGNTLERQDYSFTDEKAEVGINYYTIQQVDFDGESSQTDIFSVKKLSNQLTVYPNPTSQTGEINLRFDSNKLRTIQILNSAGKTVYSETIENRIFTIDVASISLKKGLYIIQMQDDQTRASSKLVVN